MKKRDSLKNGGHGYKHVDMERVYEELDKGRSVESVASEWNVSVSTLYRRHHEYQAKVEKTELPPVPDELAL